MNKIEIKIRKSIARFRNVKKREEKEKMIGKITAKKILFLRDELVDEMIEIEREDIGKKNDLIVVKAKIELIDKICHQQENQE